MGTMLMLSEEALAVLAVAAQPVVEAAVEHQDKVMLEAQAPTLLLILDLVAEAGHPLQEMLEPPLAEEMAAQGLLVPLAAAQYIMRVEAAAERI